ncbi:MAG: DNA-directed RNA polymerase subunit omega [Verrucomicrobiales bacterium]
MRADLVEQAAKVIPDAPVLVNLVSKRVRQLQSGRKSLVDARPGTGHADLALLEVIEGKITAELAEEEDDA